MAEAMEPIGDKAKHHPHSCPVCGQSYIPARDSVGLPYRIPPIGTVRLRIDETVCYQVSDWFARVYVHGDLIEDFR